MRRISKESSFVLDAIRGVSAQLVLIGHCLSIYGYYKLGNKLPLIQNLGVVIFFVLSGFLITNSILRKNDEYKFSEYVVDRFARIYIAFVPALLFVYIADMLFIKLPEIQKYHQEGSLLNLLGNLFMLQNYPIKALGIQPFGSGRPFWTVAVEWWIYLFVGYVLIYLKKNSLFTAKNLFILLILMVVPVFNIVGRGDGLMLTWIFGGFIAVVPENSILNRTKLRYLLIILSLIIIGWGLRTYGGGNLDQYDLGISLLVASSIFLLILISERLKLSVVSDFVTKIFLSLANYSYSLYLIHYTVVVLLFQLLPVNYSVFVRIVFTIFFSNLLAYLFYNLTEVHTNSFKKLLKKKFL